MRTDPGPDNIVPYSFQDVSQILSCHETLFSSINKREYLKSAMKLNSRVSQLFEIKALRESFKISRSLGGSQESLKTAISLSKLAESCAALGIDVRGVAKFDLANVLWDQGEMTTSIRMLQQLNEKNDLQKEALVVNRAEVLASLVSSPLYLSSSPEHVA
jgi:ataxia telangiectasia mutated family protein